MLEARILAAKILGRKAGRQPSEALRLAGEWTGLTDNWAACDVLATQGIRKALGKNEQEFLRLINRAWEEGEKEDNPVKKRFALVASINLVRKGRPGKARGLLKKAAGEKDPLVRKAVAWVERELKKREGK